MRKDQDFNFVTDTYKLKEAELIAFIQGKSLNFFINGKYHIEVRPPNYGITMQYKDWEYIKSFLRETPHFTNVENFIQMIEERK